MQILIRKPRAAPLDLRRVRSLARRLLRAENCPASSEVSILFTDDGEITGLNKAYRGEDQPTDVLAFSQIEGEPVPEEEGEEHLLGDVVISVDTAARQADELGHGLDEEIDVLVAHGILHLLGYDDQTPDAKKEMFARQERVLRAESW